MTHFWFILAWSRALVWAKVDLLTMTRPRDNWFPPVLGRLTLHLASDSNNPDSPSSCCFSISIWISSFSLFCSIARYTTMFLYNNCPCVTSRSSAANPTHNFSMPSLKPPEAKWCCWILNTLHESLPANLLLWYCHLSKPWWKSAAYLFHSHVTSPPNKGTSTKTNHQI